MLELNAAKQSAHKMNSLYKCFMLHHCKRALAEAENQLNNANSDIDGINANIETNKNRIIELDEEIENAVDKEDVSDFPTKYCKYILIYFLFLFFFRKML